MWVGKYYHEPWRDELHALSICNAADNILNLYALRGYEAHPFLYFVIIYITQLFSKTLICFMVTHAAASILCMYLLLYKFELPAYVKILLVSNYYFLWEFGVINRSYIFILLALIFSIHLFKQNKNLLACSILLLGSQIHMQALPLFAGLFAYYVWHLLRNKIFSLQKCLMLTILFALSAFACYYSSGVHFADAVVEKPSLIPDFLADYKDIFTKINIGNWSVFNMRIIGFWNLFIFWNWPIHLAAFLFFVILSITLLPKKSTVFFTATLLVSIYFLFIIKGWGYRHYCFVWFAFFMFYMLGTKTKLLNIFICLWLLPQALAGAFALYRDVQLPFSNSKPTAAFLKTLQTNIPIAGIATYTLDGIGFYLQKPMYYLGNNEVNNFVRWTKQNEIDFTKEANLDKSLITYLNKYGSGFLVLGKDASAFIIEKKLAESTIFDATKIYTSPQECIVQDENFIVYALKLK